MGCLFGYLFLNMEHIVAAAAGSPSSYLGNWMQLLVNTKMNPVLDLCPSHHMDQLHRCIVLNGGTQRRGPH